MKRYCSFVLVLLGLFACSQSTTIKIVDSENLDPVRNARIITENRIYYSNDDGLVVVPGAGSEVIVSASGYQATSLGSLSSIIKLQPVYQDIPEVKIIRVDIKQIFEGVLKNYSRIYYDKPSVYDITYKQKNYYDNKLAFLLISEAKLWSKSNQYNFKDGLKKNFDDILQLQLNKVKYIKTTPVDSLFTGRTNEFSHEMIGNYFFNYELSRLISILKADHTKYVGNVSSLQGGIQEINFKITKVDGTAIMGKFTYDTSKTAISRFEISYDQSKFPALKKKTETGKEFDYKMGTASLAFEFYLKDGKYIPSQYNFEGDNFVLIVDDKKILKKFARQIIYHSFKPSDNTGLNPKIDLTMEFWKSVPVSEGKTDTTLLSKEEEKFLNNSRYGE